MAFIPAIIGAAATLIPVVAGLFAKKPKGPKGPSKREIELQQQAIAAQQADAKRKQQLVLGAIGGTVVLAGLGVFLLVRANSRKK